MTPTRRSVIVGAAATATMLPLSDMVFSQTAPKKILIIASGQDIPNFDPHLASGYSSAWLLRNVYDSLVRIEGNPPKPVPHLAQSWTVSSDGTEYTFKLDPKAKFQNGRPVTAEAVKYSFDRILRLKKGNGWMVTSVLDANSVTAVDPATVKIKLTKPFVAFLQVLPWQWIVNPAEVEANKGADDGQTWLRTNLAASGAFRVRRAEPGNLYELERVPGAWQAGGGNLTGAIWQIVRETCDRHGTLLIFDEIPTGLGRTGRMFACEHENVAPDIMTLAKGLGSGLPIGAVVAKKRLMQQWRRGAHGNTFGGNPIACAAANATLVLVEREYAANAASAGEYFMERLNALAREYPCIGEVRGRGLMIGMELVAEDRTPAAALCDALVTRAFHNGLLLLSCGASTVRFMPPLCVSQVEIEEAFNLLRLALDEALAGVRR